MRAFGRLLACVSAVCFLFLVHEASSQVSPGTYADANHPAGAPDPEKLDQIWQVDPISGQVSIKIPFLTTPQGGRGPKIPFSLLYNSGSTLTLQASGTYYVGNDTVSTFKWSPTPLGSLVAPSGPWVTSGPYFSSYDTSVPDTGYYDFNNVYQYNGTGCSVVSSYEYMDENGSSHDAGLEFYVQNTQPGPNAALENACGYAQASKIWPTSMTADGSAMATADGTVTGPDGTTFSGGTAYQGTYPNHLLTDSNGNRASISISGGVATAIDALSRNVYVTNIPIGKPGQIPAGSYYVKTYGASGAAEQYNVTFSTKYINPTGSLSMPHPASYAEACYNGCNGNLGILQAAKNAPFSTITQISLPNGTSYGFQYDATYGTISKITLPTGGYVRFDWAIRPYSWTPYGAFTAVSDIVIRHVYTSAGDGVENVWTYDLLSQDPATTGSIPSGTYSTVHAPDNSYSTYSYTSRIDNSKACFDYSLVVENSLIAKQSCKPASTYIYDASGSLMKTVDEKFNGHGLSTRTIATLYDGQTPVQQQVLNAYDQWDNVVERDESDFYNCSGAPCPIPSSLPAWKRSTFTSYAYASSSNLTAAHIVNKPSQVLVSDGTGHPYSLQTFGYDETAVSGPMGLVGHDDTNFGLSSTRSRGNLTTERRCQVLNSTQVVTPANAAGACSSWATTTHTYDLAGQRLSTSDANQHPTNYSYDSSHGYVTKVTYANGLNESFSYYSPSGQMASHTDMNSNVTSYTYSDPSNMGRLTQTTYPDMGSTQFSYNDIAPPSVTITTATGQASGPIVRVTKYDGLGRVSQTQLTSDPLGADYVDTTYDSNGRVHSVSNPHRTGTSPSDGTTVYTYDAIGRPLITTNPDLTTKQFSYAGNITTFTDENSNRWARTTNGLSQLVSVLEPTGASQVPSMVTDYTYDPLGNLLSVTQWGGSRNTPGARLRSFAYDGMSRLTSATNSESGTTTYTYDGVGNVITKRDARGITITYQYDFVNRLTQKSASDQSFVYSYSYDDTSRPNGKGRLFHSSNNVNGAANYYYDSMGRVTDRYVCVPGNCSYGLGAWAHYDLAGNVIQSNLANGILVSSTYDAAGKLSGVTTSANGANPVTLFSNAVYGPVGLTSSSLGNGLAETFAFDKRARMSSYSVGTTTSTKYSFGLVYTLNGNVQSASDSVNGNWNYTYDTLNRVLTAASSTTGLRWTYDAFGNRPSQTVTLGSGPQPSVSFSTATNRIDGFCYDAAGNLLDQSPCSGGSVHQFAYDGDGKLISANTGSTTYIYDGDGNRIAKTVNGIVTNVYFYDVMGHRVVDTDGSIAVQRTEIFAGSRHLVTFGSSTYYNHSNWLGTETARTNASGSLCQTLTSLPFGESVQTSGSCSNSAEPNFFTGKERDQESGNDYFGARYYASSMGRFISPDFNEDSDYPRPEPYADLENPQSLNLYSYVQNNPLSNTDPSGHLKCGTCHTMTSEMQAAEEAQRQRIQYALLMYATMKYMLWDRTFSKSSPQTTPTATPGSESTPADPNQNKDSKPKLKSNPKHHPNSESPEPKNVQDLYGKAIKDGQGRWWAKDADGVIHRFAPESNGETHWNGSTAGPKPIRLDNIPSEIRSALK